MQLNLKIVFFTTALLLIVTAYTIPQAVGVGSHRIILNCPAKAPIFGWLGKLMRQHFRLGSIARSYSHLGAIYSLSLYNRWFLIYPRRCLLPCGGTLTFGFFVRETCTPLICWRKINKKMLNFGKN